MKFANSASCQKLNDLIEPFAMKNPYQIITDKILQALEQGTVPWRKPWNDAGAPKNLNSGKHYRGINTFVLNCEGGMKGYLSPYWTTYKQCSERGGQVRKGEKATPVVFWNIIEKEDEETKEKKSIPVLKYYQVFNAEQCDNLEVPATNVKYQELDPIAECEKIVEEMPSPPKIERMGMRAAYSAMWDKIMMPPMGIFTSAEAYYATLFHEMIHATGHKKRLNREGITKPAMFGSDRYSKEELVAEMGSAFLCGHSGIEKETLENAAAYIDGWLSSLRKDPKLVVHAASAGEKAAEYCLNKQRE